MKIYRLKKTLGMTILAMLVGGWTATGAIAKTISPTAYVTSSTICDENDVTPGANDCFGFADGNAQQVNENIDTFDGITGLFGITTWTEFDVDPSVGDIKVGSITVDDNNYGVVAVLLKFGSQYAAYKFDNGFSGVLDFETGNGNGLSNWVAVGSGEMNVVPVPASGLLLIAGLGGLAAVRRRKKS